MWKGNFILVSSSFKSKQKGVFTSDSEWWWEVDLRYPQKGNIFRFARKFFAIYHNIKAKYENLCFEGYAVYLMGLKSVLYYKLIQPSDSITGERYRLKWIYLNHELPEKQPEYEEMHYNVVILHGTARSHIAKFVKYMWEHWNGTIYCTQSILRTSFFLIIGCFDGCNRT